MSYIIPQIKYLLIISCKQVSPLIVLSINTPKPTKGLDALSDDGRAPMWKKQSIFWELPYWKVLEVRHAIDVMHLTKNLCVNLLGFLGVYGKPKDTLEAR